MTTKKKWIIAFSTLGVFTIAGIIALIAVLAAFTATTESGFNVSFTTYGGSIRVDAGYYIDTNLGTDAAALTEMKNATYTTIQTMDNEDVMEVWAEEESSGTTKSFKKPEVVLEQGQVLCIRYRVTLLGSDATYSEIYGTHTFSNDNENACVYIGGGSETAFKNITNSTSPFATVDGEYTLGWQPILMNIGETFEIYIKIFAENQTRSMYYDGAFDFTVAGY